MNSENMIQRSNEILNQSSGLSNRIARGILSDYYGGTFCTCYDSNPNTLKRNEIKPNAKTVPDILAVSVKPNPASSWIAVDYSLPDGQYTAKLSITDIAGRSIYTHTLINSQGQHLIDLRQFAPGAYFVSVETGNQKKTIKLVKAQ